MEKINLNGHLLQLAVQTGVDTRQFHNCHSNFRPSSSLSYPPELRPTIKFKPFSPSHHSFSSLELSLLNGELAFNDHRSQSMMNCRLVYLSQQATNNSNKNNYKGSSDIVSLRSLIVQYADRHLC